MRLPTLIRIPKNKQFDYTPRFYNPSHEQFAHLHQNNSQKSESTHRIKNAFRRKTYKEAGKNAAILRLIIILGISTLVVGYYFGSYIPIIVFCGLYLFFRFVKRIP